ncbi:MAG: phosphoglycerate mutase [Peptococcaceae bacterium]|nr:phosphoglycerate mutase [Peptococcaceae bacterium]
MRYLVIVPDGCADRPIPSLGGKTPLDVADMKCLSGLARVSEVGLVRTIPDGIEPGSDAANLSIMGYDPSVYLTGRASLEVAGMGMEMAGFESAFRVNLVTLVEAEPAAGSVSGSEAGSAAGSETDSVSGSEADLAAGSACGEVLYEDLMIKDHSAGDISQEEAEVLIRCIDRELGGADLRFYSGVSYRCLLITDQLSVECVLTPPHDVLNQRVGAFMPQGEGADRVGGLMRRSYQVLKDHPVNVERMKRGLNPANSIWFWGQGTKPALPSFASKYGFDGSVISAVNLVKGIGVCAGLSCADVPGATGTLHTNYRGKAEAAMEAFACGKAFVFLHVEAPDECSHSGDLEGKIKSLEHIDERIVKPVLAYLESTGEPYRILVVSDHGTPLATRTHSAEPVPFLVFDSENRQKAEGWKGFSEKAGAQGRFFARGCDLADWFFGV